jgi:acyl carrier protein|tara:strand:+ start:60 stop:314 length:255 start_codon:yes stop_codon:yes gene_type:complete
MKNANSKNKLKYNKVFVDSFSINEKQLKKDLKYNSITAWDSVGHMSMIALLEETFDIALEMDDIIDFSSYNTGIKIMKKYKINI